MRVVLSTITKFHSFDLARQLLRHGTLTKIFSGYPWWKLSGERLPRELVDTWPWIVVPRMAMAKYGLLRGRVHEMADEFSHYRFAAHVARNLPDCDIFHGLSRYSLAPGLMAQRKAGRFILDVGSSHIATQQHLLEAEMTHTGIRIDMPHPNAIERECAEYEAADLITVPSEFALRSFVEQGVSREKLAKVCYGVDLSRFSPRRFDEDGRLRVVFIGGLSLRKGVHHLIDAFHRAAVAESELVLIGSPTPETDALLHGRDMRGVTLTGHIPQPDLADWLSRASVLVLPSIEDGYGLVMLQAMACGCPVIATTNTGAQDCVRDGINGYIVPPGNSDAIADKLVWFAENREQAHAMRQAAIDQAAIAGNAERYGDEMMSVYRALLAEGPSAASRVAG